MANESNHDGSKLGMEELRGFCLMGMKDITEKSM